MLCHKCKREITSISYLVVDGQAFHKECYITFASELLRAIKDYLPEIIETTQDNNMRANSIARKIMRKFDEDNSY